MYTKTGDAARQINGCFFHSNEISSDSNESVSGTMNNSDSVLRRRCVSLRMYVYETESRSKRNVPVKSARGDSDFVPDYLKFNSRGPSVIYTGVSFNFSLSRVILKADLMVFATFLFIAKIMRRFFYSFSTRKSNQRHTAQ